MGLSFGFWHSERRLEGLRYLISGFMGRRMGAGCATGDRHLVFVLLGLV